LRICRTYGYLNDDERLGQVREYFRANSNLLPELPHLKYLTIESGSLNWTAPLISKLVADPTQLEGLSLEALNEPSEELKAVLLSFTNLKHLEIKGLEEREVFQYLESVATAPLLLPLETIKMRMAIIDLSSTEFSSIVGLLNHFCDTLTTLKLNVRGTVRPNGFDQELPMAAVSLAKVKSIELDISEEVLPLVSMIEAPLKKLTVRMSSRDVFDWPSFYSNLGRFGATLEELSLNILFGRGIWMDENDYNALAINLPNLRFIELHNISFATLEPLFRLNSLKKLTSFNVVFGGDSLYDSTQAFALVDRKLIENPSAWQVLPSLQRFSVHGDARDVNDDPRVRKRKIMTCARGESVHCRIFSYMVDD